MRSRLWLPLLAVVGLATAVVAIRHDRSIAPPPNPPDGAPVSPFPDAVAAIGVVEGGSGNVAVGAPVSAIVESIPVAWGDHVEAGDPLFELDARDLRARLPTARARVEEARAALERAEHQLRIAERLHGDDVLSDEQLSEHKFEVQEARAALTTRQAEVAEIVAEIERRTVRAPAAGDVLAIKIRPGELVEQSPGGEPPMVLGDAQSLSVRVDIDENDSWRVAPGARAYAYVRGAPGLGAPLHFERVEPLVVPKTSLTGASAERTDTRVLQLVYGVDRAKLPVYVGQRLDVFVEAGSTPAGEGPRENEGHPTPPS